MGCNPPFVYTHSNLRRCPIAVQVCLLSEREHFLLVSQDVQPNCRNHSHRHRSYARDLCKQGMAQMVGVPGKLRMYFTSGRTWKKAMSAGYEVMQLVEGGGVVAPAGRFEPGKTRAKHGIGRSLVSEGVSL